MTLGFDIDLTNVEKADNGETTYYGRYYSLDCVEPRAKGDDQSWNYRDHIISHILQKCEQVSSTHEVDATDVLDALESLEKGVIMVELKEDGFYSIEVIDD